MSEDLFLKATFFAGAFDNHEIIDDTISPDWVGQFIAKTQLDMLAKSAGSTVDPTWFQPIGRVVEKSEDLPERSQQRLAKFCTAFQKLFPAQPEHLEQARTIAKAALERVRREILAA